MKHVIEMFAACVASCAASGAFGSPAEARPLPPRTPAIWSFAGGTLPARTDYVRLTYATPAGETSPSAVVADPVGPGVLTQIDPPAPQDGALGYNVYVAATGDASAKWVRQNDAPIAFGKPFTETPGGWRADGKILSGAPAETVEALEALGESISIPRTSTLSGNILLPHCELPAGGAVVTIRTTPAADGTAGSVAFSFSASLRFDELPTFYFQPTPLLGSEDTALVEIRDATSGRAVATLDKYEFGDLAFLGQPWHDGRPAPFLAEAGHVYEATLLVRPPSMVRLALVDKQEFALPPVDGVTGELHVPPPIAGYSNLLVRGSAGPPLDVPALEGSGVARVAYYATVVLRAPATFDGSVRATLHLPASAAGRRFGLALYDSGYFLRGWTPALASATAAADGSVTFASDLDDRKFYPRRYVVAIYEEREAPGGAAPAGASPAATPVPPALATQRSGRPILAIVGDSTTLVAEVPPSPIECPVLIDAQPSCQYLFAPGVNYVTQAGTTAGFDVINLSQAGSRSTVDWLLSEAALTIQVPQIPADAAVVVLATGLLDLAGDPGNDDSGRIAVMTAAIAARAPHARIVYVGVRYFNESGTDPKERPAIDAWDAAAARDAAVHGAFFDLRPLLAAGRTADTPDGVHLAIASEAKIAASLARLLATLK